MKYFETQFQQSEGGRRKLNGMWKQAENVRRKEQRREVYKKEKTRIYNVGNKV